MTTDGAINDEGTPRRPTPEVAGCSWNSRPDARGIAGRMPWNAHSDEVGVFGLEEYCEVKAIFGFQDRAPAE